MGVVKGRLREVRFDIAALSRIISEEHKALKKRPAKCAYPDGHRHGECD
jgi:hypothetical protein